MRTAIHSKRHSAQKPSTKRHRASRPGREAGGGGSGTPGAPEMNLREMTIAYGMKQETLSRLSGFSLRAVAHWIAGKAPGEVARIRLTELERLLKGLSQIVKPAGLEAWLQRPNPAFQGSTPLQVVERGEMDRLWRMLYELGSGEPG